MAAYARCSRDSMQVATAPVSKNDRYLLAEPEDMAKGQPLFTQVKPQCDNTKKSRKPRKYRKLEEHDFAPDPTVVKWGEPTFQVPVKVTINPTQKLATARSSLHRKRKPRSQHNPAGSSSHDNRPSNQQSSPNTPESQHKKGRRRGNKGKEMEHPNATTAYSTPPHLRGKVSCPPGSSKLNCAETAQYLNAPSGENNSTLNKDVDTTLSEYIPPHLRSKISHLPTSIVSVTVPAQTTNATSNAASSREKRATPGQHNSAPKAIIFNDAAIVAGSPKPPEIAMTQKGFERSNFSTPHQQDSVAKAPSSSCPPTRTTNGHRPQSLPSPPSSPVDDDNEEPKTGVLGEWRSRWRERTSEQYKRVSLDASNGSQSKGIQQSKWASKGHGQKEPSSQILMSKAVQQPDQNSGGWGESNEMSFNQSTLNTSQQPNQIDIGGGESSQAFSTQSVYNIAQQPSTKKKASKNPNFTWNDPWDPKQANELKGTNGWPKKEKTHWPKNSEMKAQPAEDESDGGVSFKSNSNGDPNYDVKKLIDWSGNWMPPPEVWTGRNTFRDRHFGESIEGWMERAEVCGTSKLIMAINRAEFLADVGCDLVPRDWIPIQIEGDAPQQFWRSLTSRAPAPIDDVDLDKQKPWWELYVNPTTDYLSPYNVPDALIDPEDEDNKKRACMPPTSQSAVNKMKAKQEADYRKTMARRNRPIVVSKPKNVPAPPDLSLKPAVNVYLRPAQLADIPKLTDLYNHYVRETIRANEFNDRTPAHMADRLQDTTTNGLPWIVAVKKGNHSKNQHYKFVSEEIVGFANMDDHCDQGSMYRYTMEMEMYVHPEYLRQGIGKCLLDRMLELVDNGYRTRGGYEWTCNGAYLKSGATRIVKTVNLHFLHEHGSLSEVTWVASFLRSFDFRRCGHLYSMGFKLGKTVDVTIFQYTTSEPIDAKARPHAPL